jgi:hypothetical protein
MLVDMASKRVSVFGVLCRAGGESLLGCEGSSPAFVAAVTVPPPMSVEVESMKDTRELWPEPRLHPETLGVCVNEERMVGDGGVVERSSVIAGAKMDERAVSYGGEAGSKSPVRVVPSILAVDCPACNVAVAVAELGEYGYILCGISSSLLSSLSLPPPETSMFAATICDMVTSSSCEMRHKS